jgi:hypothetical protein
MAWRIVKQPNGLYARFSDVVSYFTDLDMTRAEALQLCVAAGCVDPRAKLEAADNEIDRQGSANAPLWRWRESLKIIENVHGAAAVAEFLAEVSQ